MSAFASSVASGLAAVGRVAGVKITYRRGDNAVAIEQAVPGQTTFRVDDGHGVLLKIQSRDFLFAASALVIDGQTSEPQRGDLIEETAGNVIHVHEVLRPDGDGQVWRYSDSGRTRIRVHTKVKKEIRRT